METVKELRRICQESRRQYDTWHGLNISRRVSIYITILFLKLGISANAATFIFLFSGLSASLFLVSGSRFAVLIGAIMLQFWYILDHVDGEIARYRRQASITGVYFDQMSHYIISVLVFFGLGLGLFFRLYSIYYVIAGSLSAFSFTLLNVVEDMYDLNIFRNTSPALSSGDMLSADDKRPGIAKRAFSLLHKLCTFPVIIDIFFILSLLDLLLKIDSIAIFICFYAIALTAVWFLKLTYIIVTQKIDKELEQKESA